MFGRVTTLALRRGTAAEAVRIFKTSILPAAKSQKGYRGSYFLTDGKADKCVAVTFWASERDAEANEENRYYQEQLVKFMSLYAMPPIREGYDVAVEDRRTPAR